MLVYRRTGNYLYIGLAGEKGSSPMSTIIGQWLLFLCGHFVQAGTAHDCKKP